MFAGSKKAEPQQLSFHQLQGLVKVNDSHHNGSDHPRKMVTQSPNKGV
jgi:hypothetical protein